MSKFKPGSGDYADPADPLGRWNDTVLRPMPDAHQWLDRKARTIVQDDVIRALRGDGYVSRNDTVQMQGFRDEEFKISELFEEFEKMGVPKEKFLKMGDDEKRRVTRELRNRMRARMQELDVEIKDNKKKLDALRAEDRGLAAQMEIIRRLGRPLVLERPQGSSYHHFIEHIRRTKGCNELVDTWAKEHFQLFVVEHDWAKAFHGAGDFSGGEIALPYDYTCFEFRINGMRVLLMAGDEERQCFLALGVMDWWVGSLVMTMQPDGTLVPDNAENNRSCGFDHPALLALLRDQVRATSIMLDAEVAETELRRAPERLNRIRERSGRTLLRDYHVVRLAHRHRVRAAEERATDYDDNYTRKRLHFRRGHDRHYQNYKVWIKWQLVGDPDLGFVDKEYRL